jgi:hypothetical protein
MEVQEAKSSQIGGARIKRIYNCNVEGERGNHLAIDEFRPQAAH